MLSWLQDLGFGEQFGLVLRRQTVDRHQQIHAVDVFFFFVTHFVMNRLGLAVGPKIYADQCAPVIAVPTLSVSLPAALPFETLSPVLNHIKHSDQGSAGS